MRDPRTDPRPGDEVAGSVVKAKVLRILVDESGIIEVFFTANGRVFDYQATESSRSLDGWRRFTAGGNTEVLKTADFNL